METAYSEAAISVVSDINQIYDFDLKHCICPRRPNAGIIQIAVGLLHHGNFTPPWFSPSCPLCVILWLDRSIISTLVCYRRGRNHLTLKAEYLSLVLIKEVVAYSLMWLSLITITRATYLNY